MFLISAAEAAYSIENEHSRIRSNAGAKRAFCKCLTLSETQEIAGLSSSSRSQVEADIDEFYDWLWSFEPYTAAFGMGGVGQEGEYRTQSTWNDPMRPLQKGIFLPPALFANAHLLLNKLRFAA